MYRTFNEDTEAKLAFLARPEAYPECPRAVECVETHMAWVFLTDRHAFKLKKPVRYEFLDFSTVEARYRDCALEVELNRRLAADVYLGIVALRVGVDGALHLDGEGETVDWLVKMRRLPRRSMLDWQLQHTDPTATELRPAALHLAEFYREAKPVVLRPEAYLDTLQTMVRDNKTALSASQYGLSIDLLERVSDGQSAFLDEQAAILRRRVRDRRIVEGHGDLRPEHVCLSNPPVVIDCLEFKREFRIVDPVDELSFLTVECCVLGQSWAGEVFLKVYSEVTGDEPEIELFEFYKSMRAVLRAKLSVWHLRDSGMRDGKKWLPRAGNYLTLASEFLSRARDVRGQKASSSTIDPSK